MESGEYLVALSGVEMTVPPRATIKLSWCNVAMAQGYVMVNLCRISTRLARFRLKVRIFG